jgi:ribosome-binding protein aMBF1 (putative translation factor)
VGSKFGDYQREVEQRAGTRERELLDVFGKHYAEERDRVFGVQRALAIARERKGLTQKQLAELSGVQQSEISKIERGQINPTIETIARMAAPLNVRVALVDEAGHVVAEQDNGSTGIEACGTGLSGMRATGIRRRG